MSKETIIITKEEYDQLKEDSRILEYLRNNDVYSWSGYEDSIKQYKL